MTWYGMHMYSERTQVLLTPEQLARLKRLAAREGKSVGAVIREAVDAFVGAEPDKRRRALEALFAMELPVDDWEVMKAEIERYPIPGPVTAFVDTAVLMYAVGADHPLREPCRRVLAGVESGEIDAEISVEVVQELVHRYLAIGRRDAGPWTWRRGRWTSLRLSCR